METKNIVKLIASLAICISAGIIGSMFNSGSIPTWYTSLKKPFFTPPNWVFSPVWAVMFILMGLGLYFLWTNLDKKGAKTALFWFSVQIVLNPLWSILFFGFKSILFAFIEVLFYWLAVFLLIFYSYKVSKKFAYLNIPYIIWVTFAAVLNFSILLLNR
jgi:translocator protein